MESDIFINRCFEGSRLIPLVLFVVICLLLLDGKNFPMPFYQSIPFYYLQAFAPAIFVLISFGKSSFPLFRKTYYRAHEERKEYVKLIRIVCIGFQSSAISDLHRPYLLRTFSGKAFLLLLSYLSF